MSIPDLPPAPLKWENQPSTATPFDAEVLNPWGEAVMAGAAASRDYAVEARQAAQDAQAPTDQAIANTITTPGSLTRAELDARYLGTTSSPTVNVRDYGATGDGTADDTAAVQAAISAAGGRVLYFPAGTYLVTDTLTVPLASVGGITGGGAFIRKSDGNFPAFHIVGSLTSTANPEGEGNRDLARAEMKTIVTGLRIYGDDKTGTGILAENTFALAITNCNIFGVHTGIRYVGRHRNGHVSDVNIWDCAQDGYGMHWDEVNVHQYNFTACNISYVGTPVQWDDCDAHNILFTGCSFEVGQIDDTAPVSVVVMNRTTAASNYEKITFSGCQIEDHSRATGPVVHLNNQHPQASGANFARFNGINFTGCTFANALNGAISATGIGELTISGCTFLACWGYAIRIYGRNEGMTITGNQVGGRSDLTGRGQGFLLVESDEPVGVATITGNVVRNMDIQPVRIRRYQTSMTLFETVIADNVIHMRANQASAYTVSGALIGIGAGSLDQVLGLRLGGNMIRSRPYCTGPAVQVTPTMSVEMLSVVANTVRGGAGGAYDLPPAAGGNVLVANNLS